MTMALFSSPPHQPYVHFPSVSSLNILPVFSKAALFSGVGFLRLRTVQEVRSNVDDVNGVRIRTAYFGHRTNKCFGGVGDGVRVVLLDSTNPAGFHLRKNRLEEFFVADDFNERLCTGSDCR
jgi:hypothetical protein